MGELSDRWYAVEFFLSRLDYKIMRVHLSSSVTTQVHFWLPPGIGDGGVGLLLATGTADWVRGSKIR